jgi:hypothetical protein
MLPGHLKPAHSSHTAIPTKRDGISEMGVLSLSYEMAFQHGTAVKIRYAMHKRATVSKLG